MSTRMARAIGIGLLAGLLAGFGASAQEPPPAGETAEQVRELRRATSEASGQIDEQGRTLQRLARELRDVQRDLSAASQAQGRIASGLNATAQTHERLATGMADGTRALLALRSTLGEQQAELQTLRQRSERQLGDQDQRLQTVEGTLGINTIHLDRFWLLIAAALVFLMQAGFKCLEVGMVRRQHGDSTAMKNLLDWLVLSACFYAVGFGVMYGSSWGGLFGTDLFAPTAEAMKQANPKFGLEFFLFQLAFAGTAATIVSGAMAERTGLVAYALVAVFAGTMVYPLIGHWVWGTDFSAPNHEQGVATGWLRKLGFIDFAGSTVVHSVGAWIALVGIWFIGPRLRRFNDDGSVNHSRYTAQNLGYSTLGVFLLWFGWWGFNGGSQLRYDLNVSSIILNTNIAPAFAGLAAFAHATWRDPARSYEKLIGGVLGGLVAITACCHMVDSMQAAVIGLAAGLIHNLAWDAMLRLRLDDPVGAIPVHGVCGVWGTLCVALFGRLENVGRLEQLGLQLLGIGVVFVAVVAIAVPFFWFLDRVVGLRVSAREEEDGYVIGRRAPAREPLPAAARASQVSGSLR